MLPFFISSFLCLYVSICLHPTLISVSYFLCFLHICISASFLSLPLPFSVLLLRSLCPSSSLHVRFSTVCPLLLCCQSLFLCIFFLCLSSCLCISVSCFLLLCFSSCICRSVFCFLFLCFSSCLCLSVSCFLFLSFSSCLCLSVSCFLFLCLSSCLCLSGFCFLCLCLSSRL